MFVVEQVDSMAEIAGFGRDVITLGWESRRQGHGRRKTDGGIEFAISLPNGTVLKEGDCLVIRSPRIVVVVHEAAEPVYVIKPGASQEWAYYAYQAGNRHQPVMIGNSELIFLQNPAVKSLLDQLRVSYISDSRAFTAASGTIGHGHNGH